ncbi:MalY/PatB family protein [bacterium]
MEKTNLFYDFDTPVDRRQTGSIKWDYYDDNSIIPMWVADMDFQSPPVVLDALHQRIDHGVFGYTVHQNNLVEIVLDRLHTLYDWKVEPDWLIWLPGLVTALNVTCRAVGEDGDDVLTNIPVYPPFLTAPGYSRRNLVTVPMIIDDDRWIFNPDHFREAITPRTKLFILCSPHNPTGRLFTRDELIQLADICEEKNIIICSDEIHCDLILDQKRKHIPTATLSPEIEKRTITLMAPSKTFNLPGLGCSFAIISDPELRKQFRQNMDGIVPHVNTLGYTAAFAAYRDGASWLEAVLGYLHRNRDIVTEAVKEMPGLSMTTVEATYLAWIDTRFAKLDEPAGFFEKAGVGLVDGKYFNGEGFVRLNFACPQSLLKKALERMETILRDRFK